MTSMMTKVEDLKNEVTLRHLSGVVLSCAKNWNILQARQISYLHESQSDEPDSNWQHSPLIIRRTTSKIGFVMIS